MSTDEDLALFCALWSAIAVFGLPRLLPRVTHFEAFGRKCLLLFPTPSRFALLPRLDRLDYTNGAGLMLTWLSLCTVLNWCTAEQP